MKKTLPHVFVNFFVNRNAFFFLLLFILPFFTKAQTVTTYNRSAWTVSASSSEPTTDLPNGPATKLLDGDNSTYWLSNISTNYEAYPHTLIFDMQVAQPVNQIYYVPRNNPGTSPYSGSVSFGDDGVNFGTEIPVIFSYSFGQNFINLPSTQNHRYFKITITQNQLDHKSGSNSTYLTTLAEVGATLNTTFESGLSSFTIQSQVAGIQLNWSTSFEVNTTSYNITRSSDAVNFTTIGTLTSTGTSSTTASYTFTDAAPLTGTNFYRLEQVTSTVPVQKSFIVNTDFPMISYSSNQSKNLNVFYFLPAGKAPYNNFKTRLSTVVIGLQNYYLTEMQRNGRGAKTFSVTKDATQQKVQITVVNGKYPFDNYTRENGGGPAIQAEIDAFIDAHPSPFYGSHNLTVTPAFGYDPVTGLVDERVPVYGTGKDCYTLDYPTLDYSYLGMNTVEGDAATVNIGGTAHEGGHSFGLSHNNIKVSELATLGDALMNAGNYTFGKTTTSLTATDAAILNHNQIFNPDGMSYYGVNGANIADIQACFSPSKNAIILTGHTSTNGAAVSDIGFYNDPALGTAAGTGANKDYDAVTWTVPVANNSFYVEMPVNELQVQNGAYELNVRTIQQDGNLTDHFYNYSLTNGVPTLNDPAFGSVTATITASAGTNGTISPAGATVVNCAANQTYAITPNAGYSVADILVDGISVGAVTTYTFTSVVTNHTISATFVVATTNYTITASAGANGSISPNAATTVVSGANQTYTITPSACYQITDVLVDGISVGAVAMYTFTNVVQNHTITASFNSIAITYYQDADNDGFGNPAISIQSCIAVQGYVTNSTDCNDAAPTVYPGATEICYDGLDNNCDGTIDEGCTPIVSAVQSGQCGVTLAAIDQEVFANLVSNVQGYRFRVTNLTTNLVQTIDRNLRVFRITQLPVYAFNTSYRVEVAVKKNNVWQPFFGSPCTVSTPATTTQLQSAQCGATISSLADVIYANLVPFATGYRFRVINLSNSSETVLVRSLREFRMNLLANPSYNATYSVEVAVRNTDGTYLPYGPVCNITTPSFPTTQLQASQCGYNAISNSEIIYANAFTSATAYRFKISNANTGFNYTIDRSLRTFSLNLIPGLNMGTTYSVEVSLKINGVFGPYGTACSVTTPGIVGLNTKQTNPQVTAIDFKATAYPNPFASDFKLNVTTSSEENVQIRVYDMLGKLVENKQVAASDLENLQVGANYTSGVYNVVVSQGENTQTLRVIKR